MDSPAGGVYKRNNSVFTPVRLTRNRNPGLVESEVDRRIRSRSPYFNGKKNDTFIAPHFKSQIVLGSDRQNDSSRLNPYLKKTADYDILKITQKKPEKLIYEDTVNYTRGSKKTETNLEGNMKKTNPFQNNQYNQVLEEEKRKSTLNSNAEKPNQTNSGNNSQRGKNNNYPNLMNRKSLKPKQYEITMKEEAGQKNSEGNDKKPQKTESNKLSEPNNNKVDTNYNRKNTSSHTTTDKNSDELVCDMCYNKEMIEGKGNKPNQRDTDDDPMNLSVFNDRMNRERYNLINQRIKKREKMSEIVSNSFKQLDDKSKDKFIDKNLEEKSLMSELGYRMDPTIEKVRNNYLDKEFLRQNYLKKYISNEKPTVKEFYDKYVENYTPEDNHETTVDRFPNYKQELLDQIQQKQADDYISKLREKQNAIELNQNSQRLLDEEAQRRIDNAKRLKEDFQNQNKNMEEEKRRKKENMMLKNKREELDNLNKLNDELLREEEDLKMKKDGNLVKVRDDLIKQIEEKKLQKEKDEILEKIANNEVKNPFVYKCQHGSSLVPCSKCNKSYPKNLLSKRSKSQNLLVKKSAAKVK